jgi:hypothetical protein
LAELSQRGRDNRWFLVSTRVKGSGFWLLGADARGFAGHYSKNTKQRTSTAMSAGFLDALRVCALFGILKRV